MGRRLGQPNESQGVLLLSVLSVGCLIFDLQVLKPVVVDVAMNVIDNLMAQGRAQEAREGCPAAVNLDLDSAMEELEVCTCRLQLPPDLVVEQDFSCFLLTNLDGEVGNTVIVVLNSQTLT